MTNQDKQTLKELISDVGSYNRLLTEARIEENKQTQLLWIERRAETLDKINSIIDGL